MRKILFTLLVISSLCTSGFFEWELLSVGPRLIAGTFFLEIIPQIAVDRSLLVYNLLVGVIIVVFFEAYGGLAYFVVAPLFVRAFALSVYLRHINESLGGRLNRILRSVGPVVGALVGLVLIGSKEQLFLVFSVMMGCILYVVVRDMIPTGRLGKPSYFVVGAPITLATSLVFQAAQMT